MSENSKELVVDLDDGIRTSNHIEPMGAEVFIRNRKAMMVYLQEVAIYCLWKE